MLRRMLVAHPLLYALGDSYCGSSTFEGNEPPVTAFLFTVGLALSVFAVPGFATAFHFTKCLFT
mgnify:CR=1 FL=1